MTQMARNAVDDRHGGLRQCRYVLHDRDAKFCAAFDDVLASEGIRCLRLPPRSPNLNAFAERWVRSVKQECLSRLILFGERSLQRALTEFIAQSTPREITRAKETSYSSRPREPKTTAEKYAVESDSAACLDTIAEPHEYVGPTGSNVYPLDGAWRIAHGKTA